jgi:3-oxoacyl-[acyl-carrier-protein] synthase III
MIPAFLKFSSVCLERIAYALPSEKFTSEAIEENLAEVYERLHLPAGRLELMTGIRERRVWPAGTLPSEAGTKAGRALLAPYGDNPPPIDLLCHAAVSRNRLEPATAAYVHRDLGLPAETQIFDLSNACLGFLNAMVVAAGMIQSGLMKRVLVVSGENGEPLLRSTLKALRENTSLTRKQFKPFFANLTIGCGAVAALIAHEDVAVDPLLRLEGAVSLTDSAKVNLCEGDSTGGEGLMMQTDSEALLEAGIALATNCFDRFLSGMEWDRATPDRVICHQVGKTHHARLYEALKLDRAKDFATYPVLGNVGSVSLPITLAIAAETNALTSNQKIALLGIGSGLSTCMLGAHVI